MQSLKNFLRAHPNTYDFAKRLKRRLAWQSDPAYDWFDSFSRAHDKVRFVQIGASDGLRSDPIREFILRDGWEGVLIEPLPNVFELLKKNYRQHSGLRFLNAAISSEEGTIRFWTFDEAFLTDLPLERKMAYLRKASVDKAHVMKFLDGASENVLRQTDVPCLTVADVVKQYLPQGFDLLVIDAEGHEPQIIRSIDFDYVRPRAIFFEAHHISAEMPDLTRWLDTAGYSLRRIEGDCVAERQKLGQSGHAAGFRHMTR